MSSELYSLHNYSPKRRRKKSLVQCSYLTCFDLMGEMKASLNDAVCALEQVCSAFTITEGELVLVSKCVDFFGLISICLVFNII